MAKIEKRVFVPMFGDSFFTTMVRKIDCSVSGYRFRTHVWGFFFHFTVFDDDDNVMKRFSSPCLGILFSQSMN